MNHQHPEEEADRAEDAHEADKAQESESNETHHEHARTHDSHTHKNAHTDRASQGDTKHGKDHTEKELVLALLAYLGPLIIASYMLGKDMPFVAFHVRQGALLFIAAIASWLLGMFIWPLYPILSIFNLGILVLAIIGIVHVVQGKERELPLIGHWGKAIQF